MKTLQLVAENSSLITGIKLKDGRFSEFECKFDRKNGECLFIYILPEGRANEVFTVSGGHILLDEMGNEWLSSDVEYHSTSPRNP